MTSISKVVIRGENTELLASVTKGNAPAVAAAEAHQGTGRETDPRILHQVRPSAKEFSTVRARFAINGHALIEKVHQGAGLHLWEASRWGQTRVFSHWHDVRAFLAQIGG